MNVRAKDKKFVGRDGEGEDLEIVRTEGSYLYDEKGTRYVDFYDGIALIIIIFL